MEISYIDSFTLNNLYFGGAWFFSLNKQHLFMLSKIGTSMLIDQNVASLIQQHLLNDELSFKLISRGFATVTHAHPLKNTRTIRPTFFIVDLTQNCNLHCRYCFREQTKRNESASTNEILKICEYILDYCKKYSIHNFHIQPWGGEPLLALDNIFIMQDYFKQNKLFPKFSIETNATLITPQIAENLFRRKISVGISIDGYEDIHNIQRPFNNGKGTFKKVIDGIHNLKEAGYTYFGTISVITSLSVDHIEDIMDKMVKEFGIMNLKFNLARVDKNSCLNVPNSKIPEFIDKLINKLIMLIEEGYPVTEGNILERVYNLLLRRERNICKSRGCMGGKRMVSFNRKGLIFPCEMTDYPEESIGNIYDRKDLIELVRNATLKNPYFEEHKISECKTCPWWYYCRGGCHTAIKYKEESYTGIDEVECLINRLVYPKLIEFILRKPAIIKQLTQDKIKIELL